MKTLISPSLLSADFLHLEEELHRLENSGADMVHYDVMDGIFVPNISFGIPVLQAVSRCVKLVRDVHLMIADPIRYVKDFANAGADIITFHIESNSDPAQTIEAIHAAGCKAGISVKPGTSADVLLQYLDTVDMILVMTVEPGFGGQGFMHDMIDKIRTVRSMIGNRAIRLEVDGGIDNTTAPLAIAAGADVLVSGSYLFRQTDMKSAVDGLRTFGVPEN